MVSSDSASSYAALIDLIRDRATSSPFLVGVAGPVAVGKTTIVQAIASGLEAEGFRANTLCTDAFLLSNKALNERGLLIRKGFPESYDHDAIRDVLAALRAGEIARVRVYSHETYDVVSDATDLVAPADVILVEGIVALQPPTVEHLDLAIYVDAPEARVREWFVDRFVRLTAAAAGDAASFYRPFADMPPEQMRQIAEATWDGINAPNLHAHIAPSLARADVIVVKGADHAIEAVRVV
jgi:type I pantothenate kinase